MSKKTRTKKTAAKTTAGQLAANPAAPTMFDFVTAMLTTAEDGPSLAQLLPLASKRIPDVIAPNDGTDPFNCCMVEDIARDLIAAQKDADGGRPDLAAEWRETIERVENIKLGAVKGIGQDDAHRISVYGYSVAEGSFALGMALGLRLGGGR